MPSGGKFLTYAPWSGQVNNPRMCFETALVFAFLAGRTLVIPREYRRRGEPEWVSGRFRALHPREFLDWKAAKQFVSIIRHEDYAPHHRKDQVIDLRFGVNTSVFCYPRIPDPASSTFAAYAAGRRNFLQFTEPMQKCTTLNIRSQMLEHFYTFFFCANPQKANQCKLLIRDCVRFKPEVIRLGKAIASYLAPFNAVHIRRGDFIRQYPDQNLSASTTVANIAKHIPLGTRLYISTDEPNRGFFKPLRERYGLVFLRDFAGFLPPGMSREALACLEQVICSHGQTFVGTRLSTFSGYITRLRGYRGAANQKIYFTDGYMAEDSPPSAGNPISWTKWVKTGNPLWGREYREGWEFLETS